MAISLSFFLPYTYIPAHNLSSHASLTVIVRLDVVKYRNLS